MLRSEEKARQSKWCVAIGAAAVVSSVALMPTSVKAVPIQGGQTVSSGLLEASLPSGAVVTSETSPFSGTFLGSTITGTLFSEVINDSTTGGYDFVYQLENTGNSADDPIAAMSLTSFAGFHTDVGYTQTNVGPGMTGSVAPSDAADPDTFAGDATASGDVIRFDFSSQVGINNTSTYTLIVKTDANSWVPGNAALTDDAVANATIEAPAVEMSHGFVPEPASAGLIAIVGGFIMCRRQRR